ncbi:MAG: hypothetical protein ACPH5G_18010 [Pseudooceanicola atlanticus]
MIRTIPLALTLLATLSTQAQALSCMVPDTVRSYQRAAEAEESYVVVNGVLDHKVGAVTLGRKDGDPPIEFEADLSGNYLNQEGFIEPFAQRVTVVLNCVSAWCATLPPAGEEVLAYVRQTDEGDFFIDAQPCTMNLFVTPTRDDVLRVVACHKGERCEEAT